MLQHDDADAGRRPCTRSCRALLGAPLPAPLDSRVQRWGGGLPQYAPGHLDRVAAARAALRPRRRWRWPAPAYDGVGIPVCVRVRRDGPPMTCRTESLEDRESMTREQTNAARMRELNATIRYTMWSVFRAVEPLPALRDDLAGEVDALFEQLAGKDVDGPRHVRRLRPARRRRPDDLVALRVAATRSRRRTGCSAGPRWAGT